MRRYVMECTKLCEGPKAEVARSTRAGQAKFSLFNFVSGWRIVVDWLDHGASLSNVRVALSQRGRS